MQPYYTRRSRSSSSLPTHPPRVTSTTPGYTQRESTPHAIEEAIACTPFTLQQKKESVVAYDVVRLNNMLQNFYTKTALIVIQSRRSTTSTRMNNWFNLAMADMMSLKDELFPWHSNIDYPLSINNPPTTLVIHIYLDTTHLSQADTREIMGDYIHQHRWYKAPDRKCIILESWSLFCKKSTYSNYFDLPSFYKLSFIFFRALHSLARLLPGFSLYQRLREESSFSLCYRIATSIHPYLDNELPPDHPVVVGDCRKQSSIYEFSEIPTPIGILQLKVHYRIPFSMDDTYDYSGIDTNQNITITSSNRNLNTHPQPQATIFRSQSSPILHQYGLSIMQE
ncbi:autophagy-related protein 13-domain-containing protein [Absidia repens]|uniref:Autophagy-related protein 13 n=1 Tax=Absidia repens TaxID=90262 RepID=A0A1X2IDG3_9FUNG|nr:autophagy-related protein 13-domain-containing protein [Absidia repens]